MRDWRRRAGRAVAEASCLLEKTKNAVRNSPHGPFQQAFSSYDDGSRLFCPQ